KQIEEICREEGYTGSLTTLNTMIAEERRKTMKNESKSYSFRQKIISIVWDFTKDNHVDRFHQLHPSLLETFPEVIEIDRLVGSFRELFNEKSIGSLDDWMAEYQNSSFSEVHSFINGLNQDLEAVKLSVQEDCQNSVN